MQSDAGDRPKPTRTSEEIQSTLSEIRKAAAIDHVPGAQSRGMDGQERVVVASLFDATSAGLYRQTLGDAGVRSSAVRRAIKTEVSVDYEDRETAIALLATHLKKYPNRRLGRLRREWDGLIFGTAIGLCLGLTFAMDRFPDPSMVGAVVPFALVGGLIGHLYDRLRCRRRLGVWEFLVVATLPAVFCFLWIVVNKLLD